MPTDTFGSLIQKVLYGTDEGRPHSCPMYSLTSSAIGLREATTVTEFKVLYFLRQMISYLRDGHARRMVVVCFYPLRCLQNRKECSQDLSLKPVDRRLNDTGRCVLHSVSLEVPLQLIDKDKSILSRYPVPLVFL